MKNEDFDQALHEAFSGDASAEVHERMDKHFQAAAAKLRTRDAEAFSHSSQPTLSRWLWPGVSLAGVAVVAIVLVSIFSSPTPSWAQVVERFRTLNFFGVTVYFTANPALPPEKIEIWATHDHRSRVHYRGLILIGEGDKPLKVVRAETGEEVPLSELNGNSASDEAAKGLPAMDVALHVQEALSRMPNFSLDELLATFSGKREDLHPVPNVDTGIGADMEVFDMTSPISPEWIRLWVLKRSQLPVRIRSVDPRRGDQLEAVFDYFTQMPEEAFDSVKIQTGIRNKQGGANRLYALLKDPGGRPVTPEELFAKNGFHLPQLASAGRTSEGVLWIQSHKAVNQRPDGGTFYGWGKLTDDLGQEYLRVEIGQRLEGDLQEEYYIPMIYGAEYRKPASYTLTCWDRENGIRQFWRSSPTNIIGSVEVKEWKENSPLPRLFDDMPAPIAADFVHRLLSEFLEIEDWPRFDSLAATIPGTPEESPLALYRDIMVARKLDLIRQHDEAASLRARLYPLVKDRVKKGTWEEWQLIKDHIADLVRAGQREAARPLANQFVADVPVQREIHIESLIRLLTNSGMKRGEMQKFFDEDVLSLPRVKKDLEDARLFQSEEQDQHVSPRFAAWREYVGKLGTRYGNQALPAECEFLDEGFVLPKDQAAFATLELPGHPEYHVTYLPYTETSSLGFLTAANRELDSSLVTVARPLKGTVKPAVCVSRSDMDWKQIWAAYLKHNHIEIVERSTRRKVLVARYNGRKLPNCFQVTPLNGSTNGATPAFESNGDRNNAGSVLHDYAQAMNQGLPEGDARRVIIVNETGLPDKPGPNQSAANVCLVYDSAFWVGDEANKRAADWFRDNFGITFHAEEREMKLLEIRSMDQ